MPPNKWSTGLFSCCEDCAGCCLTCFCPCIAHGMASHAVNGGGEWTPCCLYYITYPFYFPTVCIYGPQVRRNLRNKYGLVEAPCGDCCVHIFCHTCATCQEIRELKNRGAITSPNTKPAKVPVQPKPQEPKPQEPSQSQPISTSVTPADNTGSPGIPAPQYEHEAMLNYGRLEAAPPQHANPYAGTPPHTNHGYSPSPPPPTNHGYMPPQPQQPTMNYGYAPPSAPPPTGYAPTSPYAAPPMAPPAAYPPLANQAPQSSYPAM